MYKRQYWKGKEYQTEKLLKDMGFEKTERMPLSRDVLAKTSEDVICPELKLLIDEKSTRAEKMITIKREDLEDIQNASLRKSKEWDGIVVFSFFGDRKKYAII